LERGRIGELGRGLVLARGPVGWRPVLTGPDRFSQTIDFQSPDFMTASPLADFFIFSWLVFVRTR
jgi:hypothetical protein